jgi:hypothetical protein
VKALLA